MAVRALYSSSTLTFDRYLDWYLELNPTLTLDRALAFTLNRALAFNRYLDIAYYVDLNFILSFALKCVFSLDRDLNQTLPSQSIFCLRQLRNELPTSNHSEALLCWWSSNGEKWIEKLRKVMIEYRNIGHDWQFKQSQKQQLQKYYEANQFLLDLISIQGSTTKDCRKEIEDGLLLPWAELQRRQPHLYGELE